MSFQSAPVSAAPSGRACTAAFAAVGAGGRKIRRAPPVGPGAAADAGGAQPLRIHLDHMGIVLDLLPASGVAGGVRVTAPAGWRGSAERIEWQAAEAPLDRLHAFLSGEADTENRLVERLSAALAAIDGADERYSGLYADAVRLAIIARMISLGEPRQAAAPVPAVAKRTASPPAPRRHLALPPWRLKRVIAYLDEHLDETVTLAAMAAAAGLSPMHFAAQFRVATGQRPHDYLQRRRIERAQRLLRETALPLAEIALMAGFKAQAHFTTVFRRLVGTTPHRWRAGRGG